MVIWCNLCNKRVSVSVITCHNCKLSYHKKCVNSTQSDKWYCIMCINEIFPFSSLDESAFKNILSESYINSKMSYNDLKEYIFDPFKINESLHDNYINDIDPDINYFNNTNSVYNVKCCDYYTEDSFNKKCIDSSVSNENFSLIHLNVRSTVKNLDNFENYLLSLNHKFSLIGITETWFSPSSIDNYGMLGYNMESVIRKSSRGGGVSILIKLGIQYVVREDLCINNTILQLLVVEIQKEVVLSEKSIIIGVLYRPPDTDVDMFNEKVSDLLSNIKKENKFLYIMGDFNINLLNEDTHIQTSQFLDTLYSNLLFPLITRPTRIGRESATLIDNIFTNDLELNGLLNGVLFTDISDHFPIFCIKMNLDHYQSPSIVKIRKISSINILKFQEYISAVNWENLYNIVEANEAFTTFSETFVKLCNECFPTVTYRSKYKTRKSWLSEGLKLSIKKKNKLYVKSKKDPTLNNIQTYKLYKNKLNKLLSIVERNHYSKILSDNRKNLKKSWKIIKEVINKSNTTPTAISKFNINDKDVTNPKEISDHFNSFFTNIGKNLANKIPNCMENPLQYMQNTNKDTIVLNEVTDNEIINIIKLLNNSAPGPDGIDSKVVKSSYISFIRPLRHVFNLSISKGVFPNELKLAYVTPVYKSGDKFSINNYRPVSVISVFSKILEKLMYTRLLNFVNKYKLLYKFQFGFRENYGTTLALIYLTDYLCQALNNGDYIIGICIDLAKAFDTVDHNILFKKLYSYGIRGIALEWFKSYLNERKQCVKFSNNLSYPSTINCGVPQGSILGPILFLLYVNDLANVSKLLFLIMFADDTNIFVTGKNINNMIQILNSELMKIVEWMNANKISLNVKKTQFMIVSGSKTVSQGMDDVKINGNKIEMVNCTKFLGVYIDNKLSWAKHIAYIKSKISKAIGIICKARKKLDKAILLTLYYSFVQPYFLYGIEIWGNSYNKYMDSLFLLQKKAMRIIKCVGPKDTTVNIFKEFKVLKLSQLYNVSVAVFMYKFVKGNLPDIFSHMYSSNFNVHSYNTRNINNLRIPYCRLIIVKQQIRYTGVKIWNYIRCRINYNCSVHSFRRNVKKLFFIDTKDLY